MDDYVRTGRILQMFVPCPVYQQQEFNKDPSKDKIADLVRDTVSRSVLIGRAKRYPRR